MELGVDVPSQDVVLYAASWAVLYKPRVFLLVYFVSTTCKEMMNLFGRALFSWWSDIIIPSKWT